MTDIDVNRACLAAEIGTIAMLLDRNGLNEAGLQCAYHWATSPTQIAEATGVLYEQREALIARLVTALVADTGMPFAYWTDRPLVELPDDPSELGPPPRQW